MKFFRLWAIALVAALGFSSCEQESNWIDVDYSNDLEGTWTCMKDGYAEALVISADGSVVSAGVEDGEMWLGVKGTIKVTNNKMTMTFNDEDNFEGRFEMIGGMAFSIFNKEGDRLTYKYCANDLSEEIVGMWVFNNSATVKKEEMFIHTIEENGTALLTGFVSETGDYFVQRKLDYIVVGDLYLTDGLNGAEATQLTYTPNATDLGDILTMRGFYSNGEEYVEKSASFLRVKQSLDLPGKGYEYIATYVSNAKGKDVDISMMGHNFNITKLDGNKLDKFLRYLLFAVQFSDDSTIKYQYQYNGTSIVFDAPVVVRGNMVTIQMSTLEAAYRDIDMYMFQDADGSQLHMFMPTYSFINYFANMDIAAQVAEGKLDKNDADAVAAVFERMDDAVDSINLSFVFKAI